MIKIQSLLSRSRNCIDMTEVTSEKKRKEKEVKRLIFLSWCKCNTSPEDVLVTVSFVFVLCNI